MEVGHCDNNKRLTAIIIIYSGSHDILHVHGQQALVLLQLVYIPYNINNIIHMHALLVYRALHALTQV